MQALPRIAFFLPSLAGGGIARVCTNLIRGIAARGYPVDLVLTRREGPFLNRLPPRARVIDLQRRRVSTSLPALARYLRTQQPAVLFSAHMHASLVALAAARLARTVTSIVVTQHTAFSHAARHVSRRRGRLLYPLARRYFRQADALVAVSQGAADDLAACIGVPRNAVKVIYNPIVTPDLFSAADEAPGHPWLENGHRTPVVLGAGRLAPAKDFPMLIRAFARLRGRRPARLIILGEGGGRAELEVLANDLGVADEISMPGFAENPYAYMHAADVFALSSRWEGFGNVLVEAMACGTPVVSTDCTAGPAEILRGGTFGPLVPVGDANALAEALGAMLEAPTPEEELVQRARDFTVKRAVDAYLSFIR